MLTLIGILQAITQSTRFVTAELWHVHGNENQRVRKRESRVEGGGVGGGGGAEVSWHGLSVHGDTQEDELHGGNALESGQGETGVHLKFSGMRSTAASFFDFSAQGPLGVKAKEVYEKIEKVCDSATLHIGEGLEGEALERGEIEFNFLADYVSNPERQVLQRAQLAASLYSASLAIPIHDSTGKGGVITALLIVYLPKSETDVSAHAYVKTESPVMDFLKYTAQILTGELHKQQLLIDYHRVRFTMKYTLTERAQKQWKRLRTIVMMGAVFKNMTSAPPPATSLSKIVTWLRNYTGKFKGAHAMPPPKADWSNSGWTFLGVFLGILFPSSINYHALVLNKSELLLMMGSFGALATLLYAAPASPFAQPRMVFLGHMVALFISIIFDYFVVNDLTNFSTAFIPMWVAIALVPALSIASMAKLGCINPPAAAASFIYLAGDSQVKNLGWLFLLMPTLIGCALMILVAILVNNLSSRRKYPQFW
mmetsp:Transcript_5221/g.7702  ORF Transcript_5221/g.7702 Transcript_5221/m.7702 type:complete len:482 (+) Transcript_5221:45-1490(+)